MRKLANHPNVVPDNLITSMYEKISYDGGRYWFYNYASTDGYVLDHSLDSYAVEYLYPDRDILFRTLADGRTVPVVTATTGRGIWRLYTTDLDWSSGSNEEIDQPYDSSDMEFVKAFSVREVPTKAYYFRSTETPQFKYYPYQEASFWYDEPSNKSRIDLTPNRRNSPLIRCRGNFRKLVWYLDDTEEKMFNIPVLGNSQSPALTYDYP